MTPGMKDMRIETQEDTSGFAVDTPDTSELVTESSFVGDIELVRAAQLDTEAFSALYRRYLVRIYRYVRFHARNSEEAADLTQQVFLRALDALPRYKERGIPFSAWLFRIARNLVTDSHREKKNTAVWDPVTLEQITSPDSPEGSVLRDETHAYIRALLNTLSPHKREMLSLRFGAGLTAKEIANVVGKSEAAVHKEINRTLKALKEHYKEATDEA